MWEQLGNICTTTGRKVFSGGIQRGQVCGSLIRHGKGGECKRAGLRLRASHFDLAQHCSRKQKMLLRLRFHGEMG